MVSVEILLYAVGKYDTMCVRPGWTPRERSIRRRKRIVSGVNYACGQIATKVLLKPKRRLLSVIQTGPLSSVWTCEGQIAQPS
jgi:hypothetical protein